VAVATSATALLPVAEIAALVAPVALVWRVMPERSLRVVWHALCGLCVHRFPWPQSRLACRNQYSANRPVQQSETEDRFPRHCHLALAVSKEWPLAESVERVVVKQAGEDWKFQ
jgi:hypothetical protein